MHRWALLGIALLTLSPLRAGADSITFATPRCRIEIPSVTKRLIPLPVLLRALAETDAVYIERKEELIYSFVEHPEVRAGNEVDSSFYFDVLDTPEPDEKRLLVRRVDNVILVREDMRTVTRIYGRAFSAKVDPNRCRVVVRAVDAEWQRLH